MIAAPWLRRLGAGATVVAALIARGADLAPAWQALSVGSYGDAIARFAAAGDTRAARLGAAIAQLNRPPITPASLQDAERQLAALAGATDEPARAAQYFLGRLRQFHPIAPDPRAAAAVYERLIATGVDDAWCRLALLKLAILRLTVLAPADNPAARLTAGDALVERTRDRATRRDLHLIIAEARLNRRAYDAETQGHLEAALGLTAPTDLLRADLLIQVGRLASRLGDRATAQACYGAFVRDYPQERRRFTVAAALAHLDGPFPP